MKIYHLVLEVIFALEENTYKSGVYTSLEKAIEDGKYYLEKEMRRFYESGYQVKGKEDITIDELFSIERTGYIFKIIEIPNLEYAENFETDLFRDECLKVKPTHIEHYYNYKGELEEKKIQWKIKQRVNREYIRMLPTDFLEDAGTKFKKGDLVIVTSDFNRDLTYNKIFVVQDTPTKVERNMYFKNRYTLISAYDRENFAGLFHFDFHETEIEKYNGALEADSPILLLQKIIKGELKVSEKILQDLKIGKISFDTRPNFKDIKELNVGDNK